VAQPSRPRPERADSPELAATVDMQVELVVLPHRVASRVTTPWIELDPAWASRELAAGRPVVGFREVSFDWSEFRMLFRQVADVLARYDVLEPAEAEALKAIGREGRPSPAEVEAWYRAAFDRPAAVPAQGTGEALTQALTMSARPFLARAVDALHQRVDLLPWTRAYCPFCGGDPEFALLPRAGGRRLVCGRCTASWPFPEEACPHCGNTLRGYTTSFTSRNRRYRLVGCDACRRYVKAFDAQHADRPFMLDVDTIASLPLDAAALQRGYLA